MLEGKSYDKFVFLIREIYFIDEVALMENRVRRSFEYFMWYYEYCKGDFICFFCVYKIKDEM